MNTTRFRRAGRAAMSHGCTTLFPLVACTAAMMLCSTALGQVEDEGRWDPPPLCVFTDPPYEWPTKAITAIHLPSDEVLLWQFGGATNKVWTHATGCFENITTTYSMFCSGHVALSDGSILIAGGGSSDSGIKQVVIYLLDGPPGDPWDESAADMNNARWYPTCTALPDGQVLAIAGKDELGNHVTIPEIYDPVADTWTDMGISAIKAMPVYPFMFVLPDDGDAQVFYAGSHGGFPNNDGTTYVLDVPTQNWSVAIDSIATRRGAAVMYEPGKVLRCGGVDVDTDLQTPVTQMIDLSDPASPLPDSWDTDADWDMFKARRHHNLVLLADGTILAIGGKEDTGMGTAAVLEAELFDPNAAVLGWVEMATMVKPRLEHSTALLLPDATVLAAGAPNDPDPPNEPTAEIYSPAYLFKAGGGDADRPVISVAPTDVTYGSDFDVVLTFASPVPVGEIDTVSFVRLGATTHAVDMDQRYVSLTFEVTGFYTLEVTAPADGSLAPQGYYMLFLISDDGAPSIAKYVRLYDPA